MFISIFYRLVALIVFVLGTLMLAAAAGGFGFVPNFAIRGSSVVGVAWAALALAIVAYALSWWFGRMSRLGPPETDFGRSAAAFGIGLTIRNVGLLFILCYLVLWGGGELLK